MRILNLYAGIGGNRALWGDEHKITAVESEQYIADTYKQMFPNDEVIVGDAHQYLIDHFKEFDFIWSSPPCPSHSKQRLQLQGRGLYRFPDMKLYEEIIFLRHFYKGNWVVENVIGYYDPLVKPERIIDRHYFWSSFPLTYMGVLRDYNVNRATKEELAAYHGITLPDGTKDQRKLLRNAVNPEVGLHVLNQALAHTLTLSEED